jgi:hypothetical protein
LLHLGCWASSRRCPPPRCAWPWPGSNGSVAPRRWTSRRRSKKQRGIWGSNGI